ncbi:hypothetical protein SALBM217S_08151 [Streptomyces griseoloalbus]
MNCPMPSGPSCSRCCPGPSGAAGGWTTGRSSTGSCGSSGPERPGGTCPSGMAPGRRCTPASAGGPRTAPSSGCSGPPRPGPTRPGTSSGWCRSTHDRPSPPARGRSAKRGLHFPGLGRSRGGLTSKIHLACDGAGRPLAFTVTGGNTNDCTQFTAVMEAIRMPRPGQGKAPGPTRPRHRRQGLQFQGHTHLAAATEHPAHHSGTVRPGSQPAPARQSGRTSAGLRPRDLQAAQRRSNGARNWATSSCAHIHALTSRAVAVRGRCRRARGGGRRCGGHFEYSFTTDWTSRADRCGLRAAARRPSNARVYSRT